MTGVVLVTATERLATGRAPRATSLSSQSRQTRRARRRASSPCKPPKRAGAGMASTLRAPVTARNAQKVNSSSGASIPSSATSMSSWKRPTTRSSSDSGRAPASSWAASSRTSGARLAPADCNGPANDSTRTLIVCAACSSWRSASLRSVSAASSCLRTEIAESRGDRLAHSTHVFDAEQANALPTQLSRAQDERGSPRRSQVPAGLGAPHPATRGTWRSARAAVPAPAAGRAGGDVVGRSCSARSMREAYHVAWARAGGASSSWRSLESGHGDAVTGALLRAARAAAMVGSPSS